MSESNPETVEQIELIQTMLKEYEGEITGWQYMGRSSLSANARSLIDVLIGQIKSDAARIQNLQLKLGQLVERGP